MWIDISPTIEAFMKIPHTRVDTACIASVDRSG
jgi:hypothetical protein